MKNTLKFSTSGETLICTTDDGTNRLFINGTEISSDDWTGSGIYTITIEGHSIEIIKVEDTDGNVGIKKTGDYTYQLFKYKEKHELTFDDIYPVGSIYMSTSGTNPSELFGGTWEAYAKGRTLIGVDPDDSDFDTVESTGGSKTHNHVLGVLKKAFAKFTWSTGNQRMMMRETQVETWQESSRASVSITSQTPSTSSWGVEVGGESDDQTALPPYITTYIWLRVA